MILTHVKGTSRPIDSRSGMEIEYNLALTYRDLAALQFHCGGKCPAFTAAVKKHFEQQSAKPDPLLTCSPVPLSSSGDQPLLLTGPGGGYVRAWRGETSKRRNVETSKPDSSPCHAVASAKAGEISNLTSDLIGGSPADAMLEQVGV